MIALQSSRMDELTISSVAEVANAGKSMSGNSESQASLRASELLKS